MISNTDRGGQALAPREPEARYQSLLEQVPAITYMARFTDQGSTFYVSPQIEELLGFKTQEWVDDPELWRKQLHPDDRERVLEAHRRSQQFGQRFQAEYRLLARDGRVVWIQDTATVVYDDQGRLRFAQGVAVDITAHKQIQLALEEHEKRFRAFFENSFDGVGITGADGTILYASPAISTILGDPPEQLIGVNAFSRIHPDDLDLALQMHEQMLRSPGKTLSLELRCRRNDGVWRWLEFRLRNLLHDPNIGGVVSNVRDVTLRRQIEDELRASEKRHRALIEHSWDGIVLVDAAGLIFFTSPSVTRILGYGPGDLQGRHVLQMIHPDDAPRIAGLLQQLLATPHGTITAQYRFLHRDGTWRWLEGTGTNLLDEPSVQAVVGNFRDITRRKLAEDKLREYSEHLKAMSQQLITAHEAERAHLARELHDEFGQVLASLGFHLHAAKAQAGADVQKHLHDCTQVLQLAMDQVRNLSLDLRPTMLDVLGLESALRWLAERHQERGRCQVQVVGHVDQAQLSPEVAITCFRLAQEALTNVARHSHANHVWIELQARDARLEIVIRDDGIGFDIESVQQQLAHQRKFGLLGMRERVQLLGGALALSSSPGQGTKIVVSLPLDQDGGSRHPPE